MKNIMHHSIRLLAIACSFAQTGHAQQDPPSQENYTGLEKKEIRLESGHRALNNSAAAPFPPHSRHKSFLPPQTREHGTRLFQEFNGSWGYQPYQDMPLMLGVAVQTKRKTLTPQQPYESINAGVNFGLHYAASTIYITPGFSYDKKKSPLENPDVTEPAVSMKNAKDAPVKAKAVVKKHVGIGFSTALENGFIVGAEGSCIWSSPGKTPEKRDLQPRTVSPKNKFLKNKDVNLSLKIAYLF